MRRIKYPQEIDEEYLKLFSGCIERKNKKWEKWRDNVIDSDLTASNVFPEKFKDVLIAPVESLVLMFVYYYDHRDNIHIRNTQKELKSIFNYNDWQPEIANFFMQYAKDLEVHTCFYCETSYINKYKDKNSRNRNHFDLDHFLPKTLCPIVGLSIRNFIPSCAVCNEKLKRDKIPGISDTEMPISDKKDEIIKMCPSSDSYSFDMDVSIRIEPVKIEDFTRTLRLQDQPERYEIQFENTDDFSPYRNEIKMFHLEERYNYHKMEALRLYDLLNDYPPELVQKISELFYGKKDVDEVKEDLFGLLFSQNQHRCFDKMKQDIAILFKK
ncbi:MAG: hypothetical protein VZQ98_15515 [Bacteroidales bacterium]|nr:hypothetical protein [Bacteroidales bacterium]